VKLFPWWLLGGAVFTLVVLVALQIAFDRLSLGSAVLIGWGVAIGTWIREGNLAAASGDAAEDAVAHHRRAEPFVAIFYLLLFLGLSLVLPYMIRFGPREDEATTGLLALVGAAFIVAAGLFIAALALRKLIRRRRAERRTTPAA
jgi:hypothetical protein